MNGTVRLLLLVDAALALGLAALLWFPGSAGREAGAFDAAPPAQAEAAPGRPAFAPPPLEAVAEIGRRPLFDRTRRPSNPPTTADGPKAADLRDVALVGVIIGPGRRAVLLGTGESRPVRLTEGQAFQGWVVDAVTPGTVTLTRAGISKTLKFDAKNAPTAR
jgi:hypothetical protein